MTFTNIKVNGDLISDALENKFIQKQIENLIKNNFESQKTEMIQGFLNTFKYYLILPHKCKLICFYFFNDLK